MSANANKNANAKPSDRTVATDGGGGWEGGGWGGGWDPDTERMVREMHGLLAAGRGGMTKEKLLQTRTMLEVCGGGGGRESQG